MAETPYLETEILLAVMNENEARAIELIAELGDRSLNELSGHAKTMRLLIHETQDQRRRQDATK